MRILALATLPGILFAQPFPETVTTQRDQQSLAVTIYNDNLALVRDQRELKLPKGNLALAFEEVAAMIRPETALLKNLTAAKDFWINEQNFDFDLLTPQKLLEKYIGRKVTVVTQVPNPDGAGSRERREEAEVLATGGGVVLRFPDRIETAAPGRIIYPGVPGNLRSRPTLVLDLHSGSDQPQKLELTYLTEGLSWQADYVASLAPDGDTLDLSGWVTLTNQSGTAYPGATLQLVAGEVNRVQPPGRMALAAALPNPAMAKAPAMKEESLFEYHLYTLDRPTTIKDNQTKQVSLLTARNVPVHKTYTLRGATYYYTGRYDDLGQKLPVGVQVEFANRADAGLGLPLPKGVVRVYKRDSSGRPQFLGEDAIDHTPKNETVRLTLGEAFDLTARRRQTDFKSLGSQGQYHSVVETAFQVILNNAKPEAVTVAVLEPIQGDWEIVEKNQPFTREGAGLAKFLVNVPAEGQATLTYRARVRW
jgi:hypothetical protein